MAKEKFLVAFDIQHAGPGYDAIKSASKFKKGETIPAIEPVTGLRGQVFNAKVVELEAESVEEAGLIASEAYGSRGGVSGACKGSNWEFKSA